jgi:hypothetical protein
MTDQPTFSADQPELRALAQMAGVDPSKMAAGFNEPEKLFDYISLAQLARLKTSADRLGALSLQLVAAMDIYTRYAQAFREANAEEPLSAG